MLRSTIFLMGTLISVIEAVTMTNLTSPVKINLGQNATFTISLSELTSDDMLSWMVNDEIVANLSLAGDGLSQLDGEEISDDLTYEVTTDGNDITLTLITPDITWSNSEIKFTAGAVDSNVATLIITVVCGSTVDGATEACSEVGCQATGQTNSTTNDGKYQICNNTYTCINNGTWTLDNIACSESICNESGTWGENCTEECSEGCPTMICFANGSCADAAYVNVVSCKNGFSGDKCDQKVTTTTPTTTTTTTTATPTTTSTTTSTTSSSSTTSDTTDGSAEAPQTTATVTPTEELDDCTTPPSESCTKAGMEVSKNCTRTPGKIESCVWICTDGVWQNSSSECPYICEEHMTWGPKCNRACGSGCKDIWNETARCDAATGQCVDPETGMLKQKGDCLDGYRGDNCDEPVCKQDCLACSCLAKDYCGNCPKHYDYGRNVRLEGFLKGSLPSLAILGIVVILLTVSSKLYIRRKIKEA